MVLSPGRVRDIIGGLAEHQRQHIILPALRGIRVQYPRMHPDSQILSKEGREASTAIRQFLEPRIPSTTSPNQQTNFATIQRVGLPISLPFGGLESDGEWYLAHVPKVLDANSDTEWYLGDEWR